VSVLRMDGRACLAAILLAATPAMVFGQTAPAPSAAAPPIATDHAKLPTKPVRAKDRRRAAKLYLEGTKLFERSQFEGAIHDYEEAAGLDPTNRDYSLAAAVARSHAVTALIQQAAQAGTRGDMGASRAALQRARDLDPKNPLIAEHINDLANRAIAGEPEPLYEESARSALDGPGLEPSTGPQSFHLKLDRRSLIQRVYKAYGIDATLDQSVQATPARFDADDVSFNQAVDLLNMATNSFDVPIDAHRVLVARDTRENRTQFLRQELETIYLPGMTQAELTEVSNIAKNIFSAQQVAVEETTEAVTVRAPTRTLDAFNATMRDLVNGRSEVLLDVRIIQLAHSNQRTTGAQLPQQVTAFNVFAEEQQLLNQNQALVQEIISSGLASPGDTLAILGILLASGQVSSSLFTNGIALFGGGLTTSGLSPGPATLNLNLNSSDSKELDAVELRLTDGQDETIMSGERYPILTASYSSGLTTNGVSIPGLTSAGSSSGLSSLLSSVSGSAQQIPQVQYQDLGLTLKTNPKVMRSGDVALTVDLKITALAGGLINDIPILNNRSYSGVVTLKSGEGIVLMSELDKSESLAVSGTPGLSEIPGLNNITSKNTQQSTTTLLIVLTPHLVRAPHYPSNPERTLRIERSATGQ
jgi:Flp pilus assembly secretin CpaC/tetratricopeptide (TPR) repeat protein